MPSSFVIKHLDLEFDRSSFNRWTNEFGQTAFFDPSLEFDGPSFGLFDCNSIDSMLSMNEWVLVWLIGGEKMILDEAQSMVAARMVYNSMLWTTGDGKIHNDDRHYME